VSTKQRRIAELANQSPEMAFTSLAYFMDCSNGFRPGRSAHQALESLWKQTMNIAGGWILEVDIRKFFDHLSHEHMRSFLQRRVRDGVLKKLIHEWLKAGVMVYGSVSYPEGPKRDRTYGAGLILAVWASIVWPSAASHR